MSTVITLCDCLTFLPAAGHQPSNSADLLLSLLEATTDMLGPHRTHIPSRNHCTLSILASRSTYAESGFRHAVRLDLGHCDVNLVVTHFAAFSSFITGCARVRCRMLYRPGSKVKLAAGVILPLLR